MLLERRNGLRRLRDTDDDDDDDDGGGGGLPSSTPKPRQYRPAV